MKDIALLLLASLALAGCVGDGVQFGGIDVPAAIPAATIPCDSSGVRRSQDGEKEFPPDAVQFFMALQTQKRNDAAVMLYDVSENGQAVNIRFAGPSFWTKHATYQKLIVGASRFLQTSRYAWPDQPAFATNCRFTMNFAIDWTREEQSAADRTSP
jgi:hypothetical protein